MWESLESYTFEEKTFKLPRNNMIWCLFSIDNNYDQPDNNLVCFWFEKPSFDTLSKALGWKPFTELSDSNILYVVNLWKGAAAQDTPGGTTYRLQQVREGEVLDPGY